MSKRKQSNPSSLSKRFHEAPPFEELPRPFAERLFSCYLSLDDLKHCFLVSRSWSSVFEPGAVPALLDQIEACLLSQSSNIVARIASLLYLLREKDPIAAERARVNIVSNSNTEKWSLYNVKVCYNIPLFNPSADQQCTWTPWKAFERRFPVEIPWNTRPASSVHRALKNGMPTSAMLKSIDTLIHHQSAQSADIFDVFSVLMSHLFPLYALGTVITWLRQRGWVINLDWFMKQSVKKLAQAPFSSSYLMQLSAMGRGTVYIGGIIARWLLWVHKHGAWKDVHQEILELGLDLGAFGIKYAAEIAWKRLPLTLRAVGKHPWISRRCIDDLWNGGNVNIERADIICQTWDSAGLKVQSNAIRASLLHHDPALFLDAAIPKTNRLGCLQNLFRYSRTKPKKYKNLIPVFNRLGFKLTCPESGQCTIHELH